MTFPSRVQVGPHVYQLDYDNNLKDRGSDGETYPGTCRILIADHLSYTQERDTVLHETLHAVWSATNLDKDVEETVVSALSAPLLDVLRNNAALVDYLTSP